MMNGQPIPATAPLIAIGVPSYDMVCAEFAMSMALVTGRLGARGIPFCYFSARHFSAAAGRNLCVAEAQKAGADHLFFMDSDMIVPPDAVEVLLSRNKPVVGSLYRRRGPPFDMMGMALERGGIEVAGGVIEMSAIPTGCMLIDMRVFEKLTKPYFHHRIRDGEETEDSEDYVFCDEARAAGFTVWADIDVTRYVKHIGFRHIGVDFAEAAAAQPQQVRRNPDTGKIERVA